MTLDDAYSARMLELARQAPSREMATGPGVPGASERHAKLCGSSLALRLRWHEEAVAALAMDVSACALGRAGAAIVAEAAPGASLDVLRRARDAAAGALATGTFDAASLPKAWADIALLTSLKDYAARHASVMLAFEAVVEAAETARDAQAAIKTSVRV